MASVTITLHDDGQIEMEPDPHALRLRVRQYGTETLTLAEAAGFVVFAQLIEKHSEFKTGRSLIYTG